MTFISSHHPRLPSFFQQNLARAAATTGAMATAVADDLRRIHEITALPEPTIIAPGECRDLDFATRPLSGYAGALSRVFGEEHTVYNLLSLGATVETAYEVLARYAWARGLDQLQSDMHFMGKGFKVSLEDSSLSIEERYPRLKPDPLVIQMMRGRMMRLSRFMAAIHSMDLNFVGTENIPPDGKNCVYIVITHSSIGPDFLLPLVDPYVMYAADEENFRQSQRLRDLKVSVVVDRTGYPVVDRSGDINRNRRFFNDLVQMGVNHKTRVAWFIHGTRSFVLYNDNGKQVPTNFYAPYRKKSAGHDVWKFHYLMGAVENAIQLAKETQKPTSIVPVDLSGTEFVMPNWTSKTPFIQPNRTGQKVVYRFHKPLEIQPPPTDLAGRKILLEHARHLPSQLAALVSAEDQLQSQLRDWMDLFEGPKDQIPSFFNNDKKDCLKILVARLMTLRGTTRFTLARDLVNLLKSGVELVPDQPELKALAIQVTNAMLAANS